jgi:hypothetical protein
LLETPLFAKSKAVAGEFFHSAAANRSIDLQANFNSSGILQEFLREVFQSVGLGGLSVKTDLM